MKKLIILSTTILLAFGQYVSAQPPKIQEILQRLPDRTIPYQGEKHDCRDKGATGVYHADGKLDDRLYENVQLTEWHNACDYPAETPESCHDFILPGRNIHLLQISFGGVTDWRTDVLLSVTPEGEILDQMPVAVMIIARDAMPVMQYRITADAKIIVSRLVPTSKTSIDLYDITSFTANRVDKTYIVASNGKFQLTDTKIYRTETYTAAQLEAPDYNVYDGDEIPM